MSKDIEIINTASNFNAIKERANKMLQDGLISSVQDTHNGLLIGCYSETDKKYLQADFNTNK